MQQVQFAGTKAVVDVYKKRGLSDWAIFQGTNLNMTGDTEEDLTEYLDMLSSGPSSCVYSLRVYNNDEEPNAKTPVAGSWNFYANAKTAAGSVGSVNGNPSVGALDIVTQKFQSIMADKVGAMMEKALSGESDEEKPKTGKEIIMGYLDDPEALNAVLPTIIQTIGAIKSLFSAVPAVPMAPALGAVGGLPELQQQKARVAGTLTPEVEYERLAIAYEKLKAIDKDALLHIEQLTDFAHKKTSTYFMAIDNFLK